MYCVDFGDCSVRGAEVKGKGRDARASDCVFIESESRVTADAIVNKRVMEELLGEALKGKKGKKVAVTFSAMPVMGDDFVIPVIKNKREEATAVFAKAFSALSPDDYLCGYRTKPISEGQDAGKVLVHTYLVPRETVEAAFEVIAKTGNRPEVFAVSQDCIDAAAAAFVPESTAVIANVDKSSLVLHLISRPHQSLTRVGELAESDRAAEIADRISKLIQYQQIKHPDSPITKVYMLGTQCANELVSSVGAELGIEVARLSVGDTDGNFAYAVGAAI